MPNPDLIRIPFAQDGEKNPIPLERTISDPVYRASLKLGFPPDTRIPKDLGGEAPDGLDFNGIFYLLSQAIVFLQKGNEYQFDASLAPYPIGALVRSNDDLTTFQSTIANNPNNPNTNMTGWRVYNGLGFIVNNLTTDDITKALSAAQGKILQDTKLASASRGAANGVASLDANSRVPVAQLPAASTIASGAVQLNNTLTGASTTQALTAAQGKALNDKMLGIGQTWQNLTASRASGVTYTNTTAKPIMIQVGFVDSINNTTRAIARVNNLIIINNSYDSGSGFGSLQISFIVPPSQTYSITTTNTTPDLWAELR